ncbi:MAG: thioredoxin domain-containing protein [Methanoregula sp.]|jgi:hypothetical protein
MPRDPVQNRLNDLSPGQSNRLIHEKSPYLLSHAKNPVDWYPWGEEAFSRAARENKPVFLSIGYSTCHWCHVMAHESFEDVGIAAILNRDFISIKVDREERPDLDNVYMAVCQQMTGQGGWPLSLILTPDKKPLFAGTYFPKESRDGYPGLGAILERVADLWHTQKDKLVRQADLFAGTIGQADISPGNPNRIFISRGFSSLSQQFDEKHGGFGPAPKFPAPHILIFLIRYGHLTGSDRARDLAVRTLEAIRLGGIHDHIGGGIHRYATDSAWQVPHFEKMLADQALMVLACTEAYLATGMVNFRIFAEDCIACVLRDLTTPRGAFCTAQDADSSRDEGAFYTWTDDELHRALGAGDIGLIPQIFVLTPMSGAYGEGCACGLNQISRQRYILSLRHFDTVSTQGQGITNDEMIRRRRDILDRLSAARSLRIQPLRDDKILTDSNALFCTALARAGRAFGKPEYIHAAETAIAFIWDNLRDGKTAVFHRYRDGEKSISGFADDYANLASALIELYESTFDPLYLREACEYADILIQEFFDKSDGGFFTTSVHSEKLLFRKKEWYDGAVPSANAVAYRILVQLYRLTGNETYKTAAVSCARFITGAAARAPAAATAFLAELITSPDIGETQDLVITGEPSHPASRAFLYEIYSGYYPGLLVRFSRVGNPDVRMNPPPGHLPEKSDAADARKPAAFLCSGRMCYPSVNDPAALRKLLLQNSCAPKPTVWPGKRNSP